MSILDKKALLIRKALTKLKTPFVRQTGLKDPVPSHEEFENYLGTLFIQLEDGDKELTDSKILYPLFTHEEYFKKLMDIISSGKITKSMITLGGGAFLFTDPQSFEEISSMINKIQNS